MLVGAGEIDAALLVVAADDGPRAQTLEHLALLDALGIARRPGGRHEDRCGGAGARRGGRRRRSRPCCRRRRWPGRRCCPRRRPTGAGLDAVRDAIVAPARRGARRRGGGRRRSGRALAIDRVFSVKGRGVVVTGSLRGGSLASGASLRLVPGDATARVREIQVHGAAVDRAEPGRTALNLAGVGCRRAPPRSGAHGRSRGRRDQPRARRPWRARWPIARRVACTSGRPRPMRRWGGPAATPSTSTTAARPR